MDNSKVHLCQPRGIEVQTLLPTASYYWSHQQQLRTGWNNSFAERRDTERSAPIVYGGLLWPIGLPPTPLHPCSLDNWCKTNGLHTPVLCCSRRTIPFPCGARNTECWGLVWGPLRHLLKQNKGAHIEPETDFSTHDDNLYTTYVSSSFGKEVFQAQNPSSV